MFLGNWELGPAERQQKRELRPFLATLVLRMPERLRSVVQVHYELEGER